MQGFTAQTIQEYAKVNRATITRYAQGGVIICPRQIGPNFSSIDGRTVLYHPIAMIEMLTAIELMKDHTLKTNDVYYGRVEAYRKGFGCISRRNDIRFKNVFNAISKVHPLRRYIIFPDQPTRMVAESIKTLHRKNKEIIQERFEGDVSLTEGYLYYVGHMYEHCFIKTYEKHWGKVQEILTNVEYTFKKKCNEEDITPPWLTRAE